jgi:heterodisulfide reductase subunit A-like polyferredoxin
MEVPSRYPPVSPQVAGLLRTGSTEAEEEVVPATYDLAIIGGGINGCGIARDAAGRGLAVHLCER